MNYFFAYKTSTAQKMKGGNQDDLYKGNAMEKKILKAKSLELVWPQYAKTIYRFGRPHHSVNWGAFKAVKLVKSDDYSLYNSRLSQYRPLVDTSNVLSTQLKSVFQ